MMARVRKRSIVQQRPLPFHLFIFNGSNWRYLNDSIAPCYAAAGCISRAHGGGADKRKSVAFVFSASVVLTAWNGSCRYRKCQKPEGNWGFAVSSRNKLRRHITTTSAENDIMADPDAFSTRLPMNFDPFILSHAVGTCAASQSPHEWMK